MSTFAKQAVRTWTQIPKEPITQQACHLSPFAIYSMVQGATNQLDKFRLVSELWGRG